MGDTPILSESSVHWCDNTCEGVGGSPGKSLTLWNFPFPFHRQVEGQTSEAKSLGKYKLLVKEPRVLVGGSMRSLEPWSCLHRKRREASSLITFPFNLEEGRKRQMGTYFSKVAAALWTSHDSGHPETKAH